jgi:hypothetical protein
MLRTNSANNFLFDGSGNLFLGADLYPGQLVQASTAGEGLRLKGTATNGATAQALKFANVNALTTDGAKIASFYSDNLSTERAYVSYVGAIRPHVSITTTPAAPYTCTTSHEGEIFYFRDTDVGAGSTGKHCGCTCDGATPTCSWKRLVDDSACP